MVKYNNTLSVLLSGNRAVKTVSEKVDRETFLRSKNMLPAALAVGAFLLILKIITFMDKSHFRFSQDYSGPELNWATYGIQLSLTYPFLSLPLPFLPLPQCT